MANPLYFRSSNPGLGNVATKANKLFEWDGTGSRPSEISLGKGVMPPAEISGETKAWSDSFTLGYTDEANAYPVFFSDGAAGDAKILKMINHVANRVGQARFADIAAAKAWATTSGAMFFAEPGEGGGSGTTIALNSGPLTFIIENNTGDSTIRGIFAHTAGNFFGLEDSAVGVNKVEWMPLAAGESITLTGLPIYEGDRAQLQTNFFGAPANYVLNTYVNDVLATANYSVFTNGLSYASYRPGNQPVQAGDVVRFVYTKA